MIVSRTSERTAFTLADVIEYETRACWWIGFLEGGWMRLFAETYLEWKSYRKWKRCHDSRMYEAAYLRLKEQGKM